MASGSPIAQQRAGGAWIQAPACWNLEEWPRARRSRLGLPGPPPRSSPTRTSAVVAQAKGLSLHLFLPHQPEPHRRLSRVAFGQAAAVSKPALSVLPQGMGVTSGALKGRVATLAVVRSPQLFSSSYRCCPDARTRCQPSLTMSEMGQKGRRAGKTDRRDTSKRCRNQRS
jgi:hypothetical protein